MTGHMTGPLAFETMHDALRAVAEGTRLRILALLAEAELTVSDLTEILRQSQPRISRHLKLLAEASLIERHREGAWAFFRIAEAGGAASTREAGRAAAGAATASRCENGSRELNRTPWQSMRGD